MTRLGDGKFWGLYTHVDKGGQYRAGGTIGVEMPNGEWKRFVIYKNVASGQEHARSIERFVERFRKLATNAPKLYE